MKQYFNPYKKFSGIFIPDWLLDSECCSLPAKTVYAYLARKAGKDGRCYPGQDEMATKLKVSDRTIRNYVRELEEGGLIEVNREGLGKNNSYSFLIHPDMTPGDCVEDPVVDENLEKEGVGFRSGPENVSDPEWKQASGQDRKEASGPYIRESYKESNILLVQGEPVDGSERIADVVDRVSLDSIEPTSEHEKYALLAILVWKHVDAIRPGNKVTQGAKLKRWYDPVRLMVEADGRSLGEIWAVWKWVHSDPFWRVNVLSTEKLREKFDELAIKMESGNGKAKPSLDAVLDGVI